jgi:hypothetical protein
VEPIKTQAPPPLVVEPGLRKRPRDPFGWIFGAIGLCPLIGVPSLVLALLLGSNLVFALIMGLILLVVASAAISTFGVALWESVRRRFLKFTLQDVLWLTTAIALACAVVVNSNALGQMILSVSFLAVVSFWWARPATWDSPKDYLTQLIGDGIGVALIVFTLMGLVSVFVAFVFIVIRTF